MPNMSPAAAADGTDLLVEHGNGPAALVLLHAAGSGPRALDRLSRTLAASGRMRTRAPAFEWQGRSLIGRDPDPFAAAVALASRLLAGPEPQSPAPRVVFGHSMGGLVALKSLLAGARADALVLYEPIVLALLDPIDPEDIAALDWDRACIADFRAALADGRPAAGVRRFVEAYGDTPWDALPEAARSGLVARAVSLLADAEATNAARLSQDDVAAIQVPTLLMTGSRSPAVLGRMAARLGRILPAVERVAIDGAGHMGPITHAPEVAAAMTAFLAKYGHV